MNVLLKYFLALSDTSRELRDLVRKFAKEEIIPRAAEYDQTGEYPWDIVKKAHEIGILNSSIPASIGTLYFDFIACTYGLNQVFFFFYKLQVEWN